MKKSLEEKLNPGSKNQNTINCEINSIKSKLEAEETRLIQLTGRGSNEGSSTHRSNVSKLRYNVPFGHITNIQNTNENLVESRAKNISPEIEFQGLVHSGLITSNELENQFYTKQFQPVDYSPKNSQYSIPIGYHQSALYSSTHINNSNNQNSKYTELRQSREVSKDVTKDLFNAFEKSTIINPQLKKELNNPSLSTIDNNTVTEARYIWLIKSRI